jgi:hypothetical protein
MNMRKPTHWMLAAAVLAAAPLAAQEDPAALVVRLTGTVQVSHGGADPTPASVGERLAGGDEVRPDGGARAILLTRTGATQVVTDPVTVSAPSGGGSSDMFARAIRTLAQAASSDARTAGGRQGMIRPIPGEPVLVAPRNGLTVTATRPTFRWMDVEGASGYTIQIRKVDGGKPMRFQSAGNEWTLPEDEDALEQGAVYAWTVAPQGGRPTREQRFRVIGQDDDLELQSVIQEVRDMGLDPHGDGAFLTAVIYRDMDLPYEARQALEEVEANGDLNADLYLLKGDILNILGHADEARAAFDKADEMMR